MDRELNLRFFYKLEREGPKAVLDWCMCVGFLANKYECPRCEENMQLRECKDSPDGYEWVCCSVKDDSHHETRPVRKGSWIEDSKINLSVVLLLTCMWIKGATNLFMEDELSLSHQIVLEWIIFCRELCIDTCVRESVRLGGVGKIVEIIELKLGKRKYNNGYRVRGEWVFGGVERGTSKYFICVVDHRSKEILLDIIKNNIILGTTLLSTCLEAYDCLQDDDFIYMEKNGDFILKDIDEEAPSNFVKGSWDAVKRELLRTQHVPGYFDSYMAQCLWRKAHDNDVEPLIRSFYDSVMEVFPPLIGDLDENVLIDNIPVDNSN